MASLTSGCEFEQTLGDSEGQGSLTCCSPWGCRESDMTQQLNKTMLTVIHAQLKIDSSFIGLLFLYFISFKSKSQLISREIAWYETRQLTIKKKIIREDNAIYFSQLCLTFDMFSYSGRNWFEGLAVGHDFQCFPAIWFRWFFFKLFICLFYFDCAGPSLLCAGFLGLWQAGAAHQLRCMGFSRQQLLLLQSTGSRACGIQQLWRAGSRLRMLRSCVHGLSCSEACGIFRDQGSELLSPHWQADS